MLTALKNTDCTFKYNTKLGRHGWMRLTPAYSVRLVQELMKSISKTALTLDPFAGTATTGLVAKENGLNAVTCDINQFLIWLGQTKCSNYSANDLILASNHVREIYMDYKKTSKQSNWQPQLYNINRWWDCNTLNSLSALRESIAVNLGEPKSGKSGDVSNLFWIAFCRLAIETSSAAFNHVSMSFHCTTREISGDSLFELFNQILDYVLSTAMGTLHGDAKVIYCDSKDLSTLKMKFTHVITSPPYPNRISYIRELRPYMYWTKFLNEANEASSIDWQSIGGTWGTATSNLIKWEKERADYPDIIDKICNKISSADGQNAFVLSQYVRKYFHDMHMHFDNLRNVLSENAQINYIVGNSTFYGVTVPTEELISESLKSLGYININSNIIRKRNSKKELFEYWVSAVAP